MTEETHPEGQAPETPPATEAAEQSATAVANPPEEQPAEGQGGEEQPKIKLRQDVEVRDTGPCRKHIKVTVNREDIDGRMGEHFSKLVAESNVTGFRPGKAPRRLIEKRFHKEVADQVKNEVLMASLEQLGEDHDIAPLSPPNIDPAKIDVPAQGPMVYEFEVEVRPQFDLPQYRGLKLKRPVKNYTDEDVAETRRRLLAPRGQVVPKENGVAEMGDIIVADMTVKAGDQVVGSLKEERFTLEKQLAFKDGLAKHFAAKLKGAKAGDTRLVDVELSPQAAGGLGGRTVQATFDVKDVKTVRLPELTPEFLESNFGLDSVGKLDEAIRVHLQRNLEHIQRRSARLQVLEQISAASTWELPQDLVMRQARKSLARRVMEMRADGLSDQEIAQQTRLLEQNLIENTKLILKEHFVLQKIAEVEKIDVTEDDINDEIERIAAQVGESPRKVRARLEKEENLDTLAAEMIERKALDLVLDTAEYEDVPLDKEEESEPLATVETQAVPGEMRDLAAEAEVQAQSKDEGTKTEG
jgi:trigger factor